MTPFGVKMREWRREKNLTQQQQAEFLGVSKAYISALETGSRGQPSAVLVEDCINTNSTSTESNKKKADI